MLPQCSQQFFIFPDFEILTSSCIYYHQYYVVIPPIYALSYILYPNMHGKNINTQGSFLSCPNRANNTEGINMQKQNKGRMAPSIAKRAKLFLEKEKGLGITRPTIEEIKIQEEKLQEGIL